MLRRLPNECNINELFEQCKCGGIKDGDQSISVINIDVDDPILGLSSVFLGKISVRSFYDELVEQLEKTEVGIHFVGEPCNFKVMVPTVYPLQFFSGASFHNVEVVVRHVSSGSMIYYFKSYLRAYRGPVSTNILDKLKSNSILYLVLLLMVFYMKVSMVRSLLHVLQMLQGTRNLKNTSNTHFLHACLVTKRATFGWYTLEDKM